MRADRHFLAMPSGLTGKVMAIVVLAVFSAGCSEEPTAAAAGKRSGQGGETVIVATFLGVPPAAAPLTNPVDGAVATAFDAKCNVAAAMAHSH